MTQAESALANIDARFADGRPSIHAQIVAAIERRGQAQRSLELTLPGAGETVNGLRFVAGGLDALFGRPDPSPRQTKARSLVSAITKAVRQPSAGVLRGLYRTLNGGRASEVVDEALARLAPEIERNRATMAALARRLVREAPDVEPVKVGIALLGVSGEPDDEALVIEVGQSEEMTVFSAVALSNLLPDPTSSLWRLAKGVHGWGRIAVVERLAAAQDPAIRAWLLREGFRNEIMYEYLAYVAATAGGLAEALSAEKIDDPLLIGAAGIFRALIAGGPAQDIFDYGDGARAATEFLRHALIRRHPPLQAVAAAADLQSLVDNENAERLRAVPGWTAQALLDVRSRSGALLRTPGARAAVEAGLASDEAWGDYFVAAAIAPSLGIDPWPGHLDRQRRGVGDNWFHLMRTEDPSRIEEVLALARTQLDLAMVGSGPGDGMGLGEAYRDDNALDFIVQELRRFPGMGWDLLKVALRSRTIRPRNMAIQALDAWGHNAWPADAEAALKEALRLEPDDDTREDLRNLLAQR